MSNSSAYAIKIQVNKITRECGQCNVFHLVSTFVLTFPTCRSSIYLLGQETKEMFDIFSVNLICIGYIKFNSMNAL